MTTFYDGMNRLMPALLLTLAAVLAADTATAQEVPYTAIVVEDNVEVRAGAGRAYYVVGELDSGTLVEVDEVIFGWLKVVPPEGVYSYISKAFVDARGEGRRGEVNTNRTRVTAASLDGPGNSYREQTLLNRGAEVRIADEEGSFYKIDPPAGTYVFLPPGSVRRAEDMEGAQPPVQPKADDTADADEAADDANAGDASDDEPAQPNVVESDTNDADDSAVADTDAVEEGDTQANDELPREPVAPVETASTDGDGSLDSSATAADAEATLPSDADADADANADADDADNVADADAPREDVETPAVSDALRAVEQRYLPMFELPLEEQPYERMIAAYRGVLEQGSDLTNGDRRLIEHRVGILERNERIASTLIRMAELRESAQETDRELEERQRERDRRAPNYDAVGELLASTVYDGQNLPLLFRVVDPATGRTLGYVEPGGEVNPRRMLGRVVGIVGDRRLDDGLRLRVFDVRRIDVLESSGRE